MSESGQKYDNEGMKIVRNVTMFECACGEITQVNENENKFDNQ